MPDEGRGASTQDRALESDGGRAPVSDEELMALALAGDNAAFGCLVQRYGDRLVGFCYRYLGVRQAAEDAAQATWLKVYRARQRYDGRSGFAPWFYRIAAHTCIDTLRRPRPALLEDADRVAETEALAAGKMAAPDEKAIADERAELVRRALLSLPDKQRLALVLRHYQGLEYRSIARICGCTVGTVKSRVHYGLAALRDKLEREGVLEEETGQHP